jgi:hypothetical protein
LMLSLVGFRIKWLIASDAIYLSCLSMIIGVQMPIS